MREKSISKKPKSSDIALKVEHISKSFRLPMEQASGIKQAFINRMRGVKGYTKQQVLKDISFEVKKGDFFGIVGRNGSGKSTLLKLISQIYTPDSGKITVNGSLVPFIELGVGFNPELTGRENVYLNGAMLGFSKEEIDEMYDEIVEFAELHDFMDQKLKNYSSGMQVRLAFSVAIKAQGDILVLDEVLAVGDEAFQRKCSDFFESVKKDNSKTVILVTHSMDSVKRFCNKAMMIREGEITVFGSPDDVANQYIVDNFSTPKKEDKKTDDKPSHELGLSDIVPVFTITPLSKKVLGSNQSFIFKIKYEITKDLPVSFGISLCDKAFGNYSSVFDDRIVDEKGYPVVLSDKAGVYEFKYEIPLERFNNRDFFIVAGIDKVVGKSLDRLAYITESRSCRFMIRGEKSDGGLLKNKGIWK